MPDPSRVCNLHHSSQQHWILHPLGEARDGTCNLMVPSQIFSHCATAGTPVCLFLFRPTPVAYGCSLATGWISPILQPQQFQILATPASWGNTGSLTHWVRPGIKPKSSWILVVFLTCWAQQELQGGFLICLFLTFFRAAPAAYGNSQAEPQWELPFYLFIFGGCAQGMWKFRGQGLNLYHSSDNTRSLTHWATRKSLEYLFF